MFARSTLPGNSRASVCVNEHTVWLSRFSFISISYFRYGWGLRSTITSINMKKQVLLLLLVISSLGFVTKGVNIGDRFDMEFYEFTVTSTNPPTAALTGLDSYSAWGQWSDPPKEIRIPGSVLNPEDETVYVVTTLSLFSGLYNDSILSMEIPTTIVRIGDWRENSIHYENPAYILDGCKELKHITVTPGNPCFSSDNGVLYSAGMDTLIYCPRKKEGEYQIPDAVKHIDNYAFFDCLSLTMSALPDSLESIGDKAFSFELSPSSAQETSIFKDMDVTLPPSLKHIGKCAFQYSSLRSVVIPDLVDSIREYTFWSCTHLKSVVLGNGVKYIGAGAFSGYSLESVTLGKSLIAIEGKSGDFPTGAFNSCTKLKSIELPQSVEKVGPYAFYNSGLDSINIPASVSYIDETAFFESRNLAKITVEDGNKNYSSADSALYNADKTELIYCPDLKTHLSMPASVKSISDNVIDSKSMLEWIEVENGSKDFSALNGILYDIDKKELLLMPPMLKDVSLAPTLTEIADNAMEGSQIESLELPASVKRVGNYAFKGCARLKGVKILSSSINIGNGAFYNCKALTTVSIIISPHKPNKAQESADESNDSIYTLGDEAFYNCWSLTSIDIPESTKILGKDVFNSCLEITSITLPNSIDSIGERAFYNCRALSEIKGLENVTSIDKGAFSRCSVLKDFTLGDSLEVIREKLFDQCFELDSITIPDGVKTIEDRAFQFCTSLKKVKFGSSFKDLGNEIFEGCSNLVEFDIEPDNTTFSTFRGSLFDVDKTQIILFPPGKTDCVLPETVTAIPESYNSYYSNLKTMVSFAEEAPSAQYDTFAWVKGAELYVPVGCKQKYQDSEAWRRFGNIYEMGQVKIALSDSIAELPEGNDITITADVTKDENVTVDSENWSSSNTEVATVENGVVTAISAGEATITYTLIVKYGEVELPQTATCLVKVIASQSIEGIESDTLTSPVYYNINGIKVNPMNLVPGIYIKQQSGKTEKVIIR